MDAQVKKGLLEYCVLAELQKKESYGYQIIRDLSVCIEISESTLYPILRRLESGGYVDTHNVEYHNRIRKYYRITRSGLKLLGEKKEEPVPPQPAPEPAPKQEPEQK